MTDDGCGPSGAGRSSASRAWSAGTGRRRRGGDNEQTVLVDNVTVNDHVTTFEAGRKSFTAPTFKNQGDCIQFVNTGK